jgi:hypothetical protein
METNSAMFSDFSPTSTADRRLYWWVVWLLLALTCEVRAQSNTFSATQANPQVESSETIPAKMPSVEGFASTGSSSRLGLDLSQTDLYFNAIRVSVKCALSDGDVVTSGYAYDFQLEDARKHAHCLLWFAVEVTNLKLQQDMMVLAGQFRLISVDKTSCQYQSSNHEISGNIQRGETVKGGILFEIATNSNPNWLRFNPGITIESPEIGSVDMTVMNGIPLRRVGSSFVQDFSY